VMKRQLNAIACGLLRDFYGKFHMQFPGDWCPLNGKLALVGICVTIPGKSR